jgi:hypothetical protein
MTSVKTYAGGNVEQLFVERQRLGDHRHLDLGRGARHPERNHLRAFRYRGNSHLQLRLGAGRAAQPADHRRQDHRLQPPAERPGKHRHPVRESRHPDQHLAAQRLAGKGPASQRFDHRAHLRRRRPHHEPDRQQLLGDQTQLLGDDRLGRQRQPHRGDRPPAPGRRLQPDPGHRQLRL